jgi:drug/metabolite transporter (DMT)-like permease
MRLLYDITVDFFQGGLLFGIAAFVHSRLIASLSVILGVLLVFAGWGRPLRQRPTHKIKLWLGGALCMYTGFAARWFFAAHGFLFRAAVASSVVIAILVGFFTLLSRQGQVYKEM